MTAIQALLGLVIPALISIVNGMVDNKDLRFLVSLGVVTVLGTALHFLTYGMFLGFEAVATDVMWVFTFSQISYQQLYKDSMIEKKVENLV